ncbi:MAG: VCBS domain-containing protein [Bacteroidaceae bacterium]|nr:VCBS domain-containing protein [Bacteroidaceae bacterium]
MKRILICGLLSLTCMSALQAQETKKENVKDNISNHFKPYGFIRNYFSVDTRENVAGTGDLFNYLPKDNLWNQTEVEAAASGVQREDLNAQTTMRFLSLTTRLGLDIKDYRWKKTSFGGKIEADFYAGLTGSTGTAQMRLRQAYMTLTWDSLRMSGNALSRVNLLLGQTWHPMAADMPDVISLNTGAPFNPFSRTPQVKMDARLGKYFTLTASALWQMQYTSTGPEGASANYIKYAYTPECYLGLSYHPNANVLLRAGVDLLSIAPRHTGSVLNNQGQEVKVKVSDRITTFSPFLYLQYKHKDFSLKAKTIYAQAGEHMNLNGGYGISRINQDGSWEYTPTRNSSSWVSLTYGKQVKGILFAGYVRNFGTKDALATNAAGDIQGFYFSKNSFTNMNRLWRLSPTVLFTWGKFQLGAEYEITSAQYGKNLKASNGLAETNLHWVTNHKVQIMTKFNF